MALLERVGPDALINKFGLNVKIGGVLNDDVNVSTDFSRKVGAILLVNATNDVHRVPMIIFQSLMERKTFGESLEKFEKSIGVSMSV